MFILKWVRLFVFEINKNVFWWFSNLVQVLEKEKNVCDVIDLYSAFLFFPFESIFKQ